MVMSSGQGLRVEIVKSVFSNASTKSSLDWGRWKIQLQSQHPNLESITEFLFAGNAGASGVARLGGALAGPALGGAGSGVNSILNTTHKLQLSGDTPVGLIKRH